MNMNKRIETARKVFELCHSAIPGDDDESWL
jgi:hypothetical protein